MSTSVIIIFPTKSEYLRNVENVNIEGMKYLFNMEQEEVQIDRQIDRQVDKQIERQ